MADVALLLQTKNLHFEDNVDKSTSLKFIDHNAQQTIGSSHAPVTCETSKDSSAVTREGKENTMKRSTSVTISSRGRKRFPKLEFDDPDGSSVRASMRRCFSEADDRRNAETAADTSSNSSSSNERTELGSPSKELEEAMEAPPSPTANLKMLFSAVSPEIRKMQNEQKQQEKRDSFEITTEDGDIVVSSQESDLGRHCPGSRKEKSLGLLCHKFLQKYPAYPDKSQHIEICLDEVAKDLNVERRRIYDIVNVLESVEVVSRLAKNKYVWHGKTNLINTLARLKMLATKEGFAEQMVKLKERELSRELNHDSNSLDIDVEEKTPTGDDDPLADLRQRVEMRKDKSLGIMSQKFLMLFLVSKPRTVNLDLSAKILIGDANLDRSETAKFKTKIRRLYDIANILTSLDLIRKVHVTEIRGRKPAFKYVGPDIDTLDDVNICYSDGWHRPSSRHSMLDCVRNESSLMLSNTFRPIRPALPTGAAGNGVKREMSDSQPAFSRHSSFDQIIQVAEKERSKLYGFASEPSSPTKKQLNFDAVTDPMPKPKRCNTDPQMEHLTPTRATHTLPATVSGPKASDSQAVPRVVPRTDTFIIKARSFSGPMGSSKQPTIVPLTSDQIQDILRSIKCPVKNKQDASTQSSLDVTDSPKTSDLLSPIGVNMATLNEHTPTARVANGGPPAGVETVSRKRCYVEVEVSGGNSTKDKRIKLDLTTPPSTSPRSVNISRSKDSVTQDTDGAGGKQKSKSSSTRALTFVSDGLAVEKQQSDALITVGPTKPVATRPQPAIQRITVQVSSGNQNGEGDSSSIIHIPVMNVPQAEAGKPAKIVLTSVPVSSPGVLASPQQSVPVVNQVMQAVPPSTAYLAVADQRIGQPAVLQSHPAAPICKLATTNPTQPNHGVHIVHGSPIGGGNRGTNGQAVSLNLVPVTFSPPLTPSEEQQASANVFSFPGMVSAQNQIPSSLPSQPTAFHVVQQPASSTYKVIPATMASPVSPTHIQVVMAPSKSSSSISAGTSTSSPFISCANSSIVQARAANV